jgi:hypothetical protein
MGEAKESSLTDAVRPGYDRHRRLVTQLEMVIVEPKETIDRDLT